MHDRRGSEPPCVGCAPVVMPVNEDPLRLWPIVCRQVIVGGMGAVIDINHLAVWAAIDRYQVTNPVRCFEKILILHNHFKEEAETDGD